MKFPLRSALIGAAVLSLLSLEAAGQQSAPSAVGAGDQLRVLVWKSPELSGDFAIAADGSIQHPLYRQIRVTGLSIEAVEERLRAFLGTYLANPQLVVQPLLRIAVVGEVRNPNVYSVPPQTTLVQAIALAGGPTERGKLDKVRVVRNGSLIELDLTNSTAGPARMPISSGDEIIVGRRANWVPFFNTVVSSVGAIAALYSVLQR